MKVSCLCLGCMIFAFVIGLVACATERRSAEIVTPPSATRSTLSITDATFTDMPVPSRATRSCAALPPTASSSTAIATQAVLIDSAIPTVAKVDATATPAATVSSTATHWSTDPHPLQIEVMRQQPYPGSQITFEQTLEPEDNYSRYVVSYEPEGYEIYAQMTVPIGTEPDTGWPVIIVNHGYVRPSQYSTTGNYVPYMDMLANNGYIVFKSDYRGHGRSDGAEAVGGGYGLPDYTVDVFDAISSFRTYSDADPNRIGIWRHSMAGQITLRAMVVSKDIKAGVIWAGAVAPYPDIIARWDFTRNPDLFPEMTTPQAGTPQSTAGNWLRNLSWWVSEFSTKYGSPDENLTFWTTISPNGYLQDLSGPIQLHHSTTDEMVPLAWSETLVDELQALSN